MTASQASMLATTNTARVHKQGQVSPSRLGDIRRNPPVRDLSESLLGSEHSPVLIPARQCQFHPVGNLIRVGTGLVHFIQALQHDRLHVVGAPSPLHALCQLAPVLQQVQHPGHTCMHSQSGITPTQVATSVHALCELPPPVLQQVQHPCHACTPPPPRAPRPPASEGSIRPTMPKQCRHQVAYALLRSDGHRHFVDSCHPMHLPPSLRCGLAQQHCVVVQNHTPGKVADALDVRRQHE